MNAIIFDFNGVLWWDTPLQELAWRQFALTVRDRPFTIDEIQIHVHGRTNRHTLEYLTGHALSEQEVAQLTQHKERMYRQLCVEQGDGFRLSPGAIELLDFLVAHHIPRTIATASERTNLDFFIAELQLTTWFELGAIVYDDGSRPGKPAPDIYLQAARNLNTEPANCIVVEDSQSGIQAAYAAGIGQIIALGPVETHQRLRQLPGVTAVVEDLHQIPKEQWLG